MKRDFTAIPAMIFAVIAFGVIGQLGLLEKIGDDDEN